MELTTLNGFLAVLTVAVSGCATMLLGSLKVLRDSNEDLRERNSDLEVKVSGLTADVTTLKNDNAALARQIRGDDKLDAFAKKLDTHHREAMEHWATGEALLHAIVDEMTGGNA